MLEVPHMRSSRVSFTTFGASRCFVRKRARYVLFTRCFQHGFQQELWMRAAIDQGDLT
jgi:hypothetical protein